MPPNESLRRVLSGLKFSSQKSRNLSHIGDHESSEYQSIAQTLSDTSNDGPPLSQSNRGSGKTLLNTVDASASNHARALSSASSPLPDTKTAPIVLRHASEPDQTPITTTNLNQMQITYQDLARDKRVLEQRINNFQLILDQLKLNLLQATKEKHALRQQIHRQDEEIQKVKDQLRDAKREHQSFRLDLETHTKVKEDLQSAKKENKRLRADLKDTKRKLETTTSKLEDTSAQFQSLTNKHETLDKSLRDSRLENGILETKLAEVTSQVASTTEEKNQAEEHMKRYRAFAQAIYKEFQPEKDKNLSSDVQMTELRSLLESKTSALIQVQAQLTSLQQEKESWQGRMDTMIHKVFASERRIRMLHHASRMLKIQNMGDDSSHVIKRGNNKKPNNSYSAEIVEAVTTLNKAILDTAANFAPLFFISDSHTWSGNLERAQEVLGEWITSRMQQTGWNRPWLLQSVIQIFLVDWCRAIIEAWYPKQQSFAELFLSGLMSQKPSSKDTIKFQAIKTTPNGLDSSLDTKTWATQILDDLLQIVPVPNIKKKYRDDILLPKLGDLARLSYNIRQALAEGDICGNVQLLVPPSDIQFQPDSMNAINKTNFEIRKTAPKELGDIAGSTSIGLRSIEIQKSDAGTSLIHYATVLAPTVILARDMAPGNPSEEARISAKKDFQEEVDAMMDLDVPP